MQVSNWLADYSQITLLHSILQKNETDMPSKTFLELAEEEDICKPSNINEQLFAHF